MKIQYPEITSRQNPRVMQYAALQEKKHREESRLFLLEGEKLVCEAAERQLPVACLLVSSEKQGEILGKLSFAYQSAKWDDLPVYLLSQSCFSKISSEKAPQGVIAVLKYLDFLERKTIIYDVDILGSERLLLLYDIQDPGNVGAILRSAAAFGVDHVILSAGCADLYASKTIRAAMGSLFSMRLTVAEDFASAIAALRRQGRRVLAAELRTGARPVCDVCLSGRDCLIIGNEGHGILPAISAMCDASVYLPITEKAESLNAAVAASVLLWEQWRRIE